MKVICYKRKGENKFITYNEYLELVEKAFKPKFNEKLYKDLSEWQPIEESDGYYIFFKDEIERKLYRQNKMEI